MNRLLITLLLYRRGYFVGKYISLDSKITRNKDFYYDALEACQGGWHEGTNAPTLVFSIFFSDFGYLQRV